MKKIVAHPAFFIAGILIGYTLPDWERSLICMLESIPIAAVFLVGVVLLAVGTRIKPMIFPGEFVVGLGIGFGWRSRVAPG